MEPEDVQELELALRALSVVLGGAALLLAAWRARLAARVGTPRVVVRGPRRLRWAYLAAVLALAAGLAAADAGVSVGLAATVLVLGSVIVLLAPGTQDSLLGSEGVQQGWHARRFSELDEWRLTGDHLRWRLFDEWVAASAPAALHDELRAQLTAANAGSESRFQR